MGGGAGHAEPHPCGDPSLKAGPRAVRIFASAVGNCSPGSSVGGHAGRSTCIVSADRKRSKSVEPGPGLAKSGPSSTQIGRSGPGIGQIRADVDGSMAGLGQVWSNLARCWARSDRCWAEFDRCWTDVGQIWSTSVRNRRQRRTHVGPSSTDVRPESARHLGEAEAPGFGRKAGTCLQEGTCSWASHVVRGTTDSTFRDVVGPPGLQIFRTCKVGEAPGVPQRVSSQRVTPMRPIFTSSFGTFHVRVMFRNRPRCFRASSQICTVPAFRAPRDSSSVLSCRRRRFLASWWADVVQLDRAQHVMDV